MPAGTPVVPVVAVPLRSGTPVPPVTVRAATEVRVPAVAVRFSVVPPPTAAFRRTLSAGAAVTLPAAAVASLAVRLFPDPVTDKPIASVTLWTAPGR